MAADKILILEPPSPPYLNVYREYAGGYGTAARVTRAEYGHDGGSAPFLPALYSAGLLEQSNFDTHVLECPTEELSGEAALSRISALDPSVIVSVMNLPSLEGDTNFLSALRKRLPRAKIAAIGTVGKLLYGHVLSSGCVEAVVRGDPEVVLPKLVPEMLNGNRLSKVAGIAYTDPGGQINLTPEAPALEDLDSLPMPPYHKLPVSDYWEPAWGKEMPYMAILNGRGCSQTCAGYCPYPFGYGRSTLYRDPGLVVDELDYLHRDFGTWAFIFRSQNFTSSRYHAEATCSEILRRDLRIKWVCESRLDTVDRGLLSLMKLAGCEEVHFGLETGDPELFRREGKPGCDLSGQVGAIEETRKAGILAKVNIIVGLPGETWDTVRGTISTIRKIRPDIVQASIATPYPGTRLYDESKRKGLLLTDDWSSFTGYDPVVRTERMSARDLVEAQWRIASCLKSTRFPARLLHKTLRVIGDRAAALRPPFSHLVSMW